jgi:hypothetical protein
MSGFVERIRALIYGSAVFYTISVCAGGALSTRSWKGPVRKVKAIAEYFALISKQSAAHSVQTQPLLR